MATDRISHAEGALPKRRRVIFNCDGFGVFKDAQGDVSRWIHNIFGGLGNHVDTLFWCDGAGGNTAYYDSQVLELTGQRISQVSPFLRRLIAEGNDPPKVIVREAKRRRLDVFYSYRVNDVHDDFIPSEYATFKAEHPEWMIGDGQPYGIRTALNFAVPEVRQLKLAAIEELVQKYDFDGIEIDFLRSPPFFIPGEEPQHAHILTEFLRDVRGLLQRRGHTRGRVVELAVRVDENLDACRLDGFDVSAWVAYGLVDALVLGSGAIDIAIEEFKTLTQGTSIPVYACLYGWPSGYDPIPEELARGLAANYWYQGADGIYTFNWFPHEANKGYQTALLNEIGDPAALQGQSMMFAADRARPLRAREYPHNWMNAALPLTLIAGQRGTVPILVGQDLTKTRPPKELALVLACETLPEEGLLSLELNGAPLPAGTRTGMRIAVPLQPHQVALGRNKVRLTSHNGGVTVTALEIHVHY